MASLPFTCLPISPETTFPAPRAQGVVPPSSLATVAPVFVYLPVWPSIWVSWPPPCSVSVGRGVGPPRILVGEAQQFAFARKYGGRVTTNFRVQDMDFLPLRHLDNRRFDVVVDGLPLFQGTQLAIDTTMVSPVRSDGDGAATTNGAALDQARRTQRADLPRVGSATRSRSVGALWVAKWGDVGPRSLANSWQNLRATKARSEPEIIRKSTMLSWLRRWSTAYGVHSSKSPLPCPCSNAGCCIAADGPTPTTAEVVADHFFDMG